MFMMASTIFSVEDNSDNEDLVDYYGMQAEADEEESGNLKHSVTPAKRKRHKKHRKKSAKDKVHKKTPKYTINVPVSQIKPVKVPEKSETKFPTGPDGVKSYFCDICKVKIYYVNPGGWWQHFKLKHGGKLKSPEDHFEDSEEAPDSPEVLILEEISSGQAPTTNASKQITNSEVNTSLFSNEQDIFKCGKCKKNVKYIDRYKHQCTYEDKLEHVCGILKKVMGFASPKALHKHMQTYHKKVDRNTSPVKVTLQEDGSLGFQVSNKEDAGSQKTKSVPQPSGKSSHGTKVRHANKHREYGQKKGRPERALLSNCKQARSCEHACPVFQAVLHFVTDKAYEDHMEKYHDDKSQDISLEEAPFGECLSLETSVNDAVNTGKHTGRVAQPRKTRRKVDFSSRRRLSYPSSVFGEGTLHTCPICRRSFNSLRNFNRHRAGCMSMLMIRVCKECRQTFKCFRAYQKHSCVPNKGPLLMERGCWKVCTQCWKTFNSVKDACLHASSCSIKRKTCKTCNTGTNCKQKHKEVTAGDSEEVLRSYETKTVKDGSGTKLSNHSCDKELQDNPDYKVHWLLKD